MALACNQKLRAQDPAPVRRCCTGGRTGPQGREGENGGGNEDGDGNGHEDRNGGENRSGNGEKNAEEGGGERELGILPSDSRGGSEDTIMRVPSTVTSSPGCKARSLGENVVSCEGLDPRDGTQEGGGGVKKRNKPHKRLRLDV